MDIFQFDVSVRDKKFRVDFDHRKGDGYWVAVAPDAGNANPEASGMIVLMGGTDNPGITQKRIDDTPKYSKSTAQQLKPHAVYYAMDIMTKILWDSYKMPLFKGSPADPAYVMAEVKGFPDDLLIQVADTYFPNIYSPNIE